MWSVIGYSLLSVLAVIVLLLVLPAFVRVQYREELAVRVFVFGVPVYRYSPQAKKPKAKKKTDKPSKSKEKPSFFRDLSKKLKTDGVGAVVSEVRNLASIVHGAARRVCRAVTVDRLRLALVVASEDAAATAQNTGRVCAILYPSLTTIQSVVRIRHREVTVTPDYLAEKGSVTADVTLHAVPIRLLWAALCTFTAYTRLKDKTVINTREELENG